jgi:ketosteroid isomerase-like protein
MATEGDVDVVRRSFEAFNAGDMRALAACWTDDVVFDGSRAMEGVYRGKDACRRFLAGVLESSPIEQSDLAISRVGERVVVVARARVKGSASGAEAETRLAYVYELRDGLICHQEIHPDADRLLAELDIAP